MLIEKWTNKQNFLLYIRPILWKESSKNCRALMHLDIYIFVHRFAHNATSEGWLCTPVWHLDMSLLCQHCTNMNTTLWRNIFSRTWKQWHSSCHLTHFKRLGYVLFLFSFPLGQSFYINTALRHPREGKRPGRRIFCSSQLGPTINSQVPTKRAFSRATSN